MAVTTGLCLLKLRKSALTAFKSNVLSLAKAAYVRISAINNKKINGTKVVQ